MIHNKRLGEQAGEAQEPTGLAGFPTGQADLTGNVANFLVFPPDLDAIF